MLTTQRESSAQIRHDRCWLTVKWSVIDWIATWTAVGSIGTCAAAVGTWWFGGRARRATVTGASPPHPTVARDIIAGSDSRSPSAPSPDTFVPILAKYFCEHCGYPFEGPRQFCNEHKLHCVKLSEKVGGCKNRLNMDITDRLVATAAATRDAARRDNRLVALRWAQKHHHIDHPERYLPSDIAEERNQIRSSAAEY